MSLHEDFVQDSNIPKQFKAMNVSQPGYSFARYDQEILPLEFMQKIVYLKIQPLYYVVLKSETEYVMVSWRLRTYLGGLSFPLMRLQSMIWTTGLELLSMSRVGAFPLLKQSARYSPLAPAARFNLVKTTKLLCLGSFQVTYLILHLTRSPRTSNLRVMFIM